MALPVNVWVGSAKKRRRQDQQSRQKSGQRTSGESQGWDRLVWFGLVLFWFCFVWLGLVWVGLFCFGLVWIVLVWLFWVGLVVLVFVCSNLHMNRLFRMAFTWDSKESPVPNWGYTGKILYVGVQRKMVLPMLLRSNSKKTSQRKEGLKGSKIANF